MSDENDRLREELEHVQLHLDAVLELHSAVYVDIWESPVEYCGACDEATPCSTVQAARGEL